MAVNRSDQRKRELRERGYRLVRNHNRKKLRLVEIETNEVLVEGYTPQIQGYCDGLLDALDDTIGSRVPKPK